MKRFLFFLVTTVVFFATSTASISSVERDGSWYKIYNESGRLSHSIQASVGELQGFGTDFFIVKSGSWYKIYTEKGKLYKSLLVSSVGEILSVGATTFTSRSGSWVYTWNRDGKRISSRQASR
ncbi:MAG: hypothetical protein J5784_04845 [Muribaculaceae bacterium]|nr:hypothetical protein [Muribaculaceae bacterium]MBP5315152.1 hypothetical protein [Muribaculaceae bacterium]